MDQELALDVMIRAVATQLMRTDPRTREAEKAYPGITMALVDGLRPTIASYSERVRLEYRPRMIAGMADILTPAEARTLAEFYLSPLGQRALQSASGSFASSNVTEDFIAGESVSAESVAQDLNATGQQGLARMTAADQAELVRIAMTTPAFAKLPQMVQHIAPIRAAMENAPPSPDEMASINAAVEKVVREFAL